MNPQTDFWQLLHNNATNAVGEINPEESFSFKNSFKMKEILKKVIPNDVQKCQGEKDHRMCEFCGFKTDSKSHLARHLKIRHDATLLKPEYKCDVCEYTSLNQAHVKRHRIAKHGGERFKCDLCDLTFSIKDSVARHKDIVHKNVLYPCAECDFVAKRLDSLKNHSLKHFESMLACEKCGVKVRTKTHLKHHMEVEHEGKRQHCKACDFEAKDKSSVMRHIKEVHLSFRYKCNFCNLDYSHITSAKVHISGKHEDKTIANGITIIEKKMSFSCLHCNFQATSKFKLNRHSCLKDN